MHEEPISIDLERELAVYETVFLVFPQQGGWQVMKGRRPAGHFATQSRAIRWAALAAQTAELGGKRATFRVLDSPMDLPHMTAPVLAAVA